MYKNEISTIYSNSVNIACDGSISSSNHPKVYLNLLPKGEVVCPYCGIKYIYQNSDADLKQEVSNTKNI